MNNEAFQAYYSLLGKEYMDRDEKERFQKMADRKWETVMTNEIILSLYEGQERAGTWRGVTFGKCSCDVVAYQQLIYELQPKTIIDIGSWCGGSALWFADVAEMLVGKDFCKVVSTDTVLDNVHERAKTHPKIEFHAIDSNKIDELFTEEFCKTLPHPWFVCEDGHFGFPKIMETFHQQMLPGDYFVVEDTNTMFDKYFREKIDGRVESGELTKEQGAGIDEEHKMIAQKGCLVRQYGIDYPDKYLVDSKYQDMFGYNVGKSMNTILKVMA